MDKELGEVGEATHSSCSPQNFAPRDKYILLVFFNGFDEIAHLKRFSTLEKLEGAAHYWTNCNDSEGTPRYKVLQLLNLEYGLPSLPTEI